MYSQSCTAKRPWTSWWTPPAALQRQGRPGPGTAGGWAMGGYLLPFPQPVEPVCRAESGSCGEGHRGGAGSWVDHLMPMDIPRCWKYLGPGQLGLVMGEVRRAASVCVVRAQHLCLLDRLAFLGPGAMCRQVTLRLGERRRRDAQAYQQAFLGRGLGREGRAYVL